MFVWGRKCWDRSGEQLVTTGGQTGERVEGDSLSVHSTCHKCHITSLLPLHKKTYSHHLPLHQNTNSHYLPLRQNTHSHHLPPPSPLEHSHHSLVIWAQNIRWWGLAGMKFSCRISHLKINLSDPPVDPRLSRFTQYSIENNKAREQNISQLTGRRSVFAFEAWNFISYCDLWAVSNDLTPRTGHCTTFYLTLPITIHIHVWEFNEKIPHYYSYLSMVII